MTTAERFQAGEHVEVAPGAVEAELRRIWRVSSHEDKGASRATLMTLVGHAATPEALARLKGLFDQASEHLPSRIILLQADPEGQSGLKTWIATNFHQSSHGARHLYSEEITIQAGGDAIEHMPSLVRALRVADVPAVLYWPGPLPDDVSSLSGLISGVDRLVVDTHDFEEPSELARFSDLLTQQLAIADLDWLRIAPWQALVAHLLDGDDARAPKAGPAHHLDRVVVEHGDRASCDAYLFCGWLASRLGWRDASAWEIEGVGSAWRMVRPDGEPVIVWIRRAAGERQGLTMIHLEASRFSTPLAFTVRRLDDALEVRGTQLAPTMRAVRWPDDRELLGRALRAPEGDRVFGEALRVAAALVRNPRP